MLTNNNTVLEVYTHLDSGIKHDTAKGENPHIVEFNPPVGHTIDYLDQWNCIYNFKNNI